MYFMSGLIGGGFEELEAVETLSEMTGVLFVLKHSRDKERQADMEAVRLLHGHGRSAAGLREFFKELRKQKALKIDALEWISTHPLTDERIKILDTFIEKEHDLNGAVLMTEDQWHMLQHACTDQSANVSDGTQ